MKNFFASNKHLLLVLLVLGITAGFFWQSSRYPALNQKAMMGGESPVEGLGFDNTLKIIPEFPIWQKITYNTINWILTNRQGMIFGIFFAAGLMLLFSLLYDRQFSNTYLNSAIGMLIGAPLGVCVNCAAPIAQGMHDSGARTETALATMISSPTLNVIVLGMLFALLPFYMAVIKIGLTLLFILLVIPTLVHFSRKRGILPTQLEAVEKNASKPTAASALLTSLTPMTRQTSWGTAFKWLAKSYWKSLWHLIKVTVPLMLLAGLLGNVLISVLPWNAIAEMIPIEESILVTSAIMLLIALIGVFLPVPMTFDVIIAAVLLSIGMPDKYVMVFLVTLGIFSIYSFFIVWQAISRKIALLLFASIALMGLGSGWIGDWASKAHYEAIKDNYRTFFAQVQGELVITPPKTYEAKAVQATTKPRTFQPIEAATDQSNIQLWAAPFEASNNTGKTWFVKKEGPTIGIPTHGGFKLQDMMEPFAQGKGITSEDVDKDGWPDLLFATEQGLELYRNLNGQGFQAMPLPQHPALTNFITNAALADMNGDTWPDIVLTVYKKGYYIWYSRNGQYPIDALDTLPSPQDLIAGTGMSLGDIDHDGDLDIAVGNWSVGWYLDVANSYHTSNDYLLVNDSGRFQLQQLPGIPGESLSTLITDFNNDQQQDIIICNDYAVPDKYLLGNGKGGFTLVTRKDQSIPYTTHFSMSTATADFDNDLVPEIYNTSISGIHLDIGYRSKDAKQICETIDDQAMRKECQQIAQAYLEMTAYSMNQSNQACSDHNRLACIGYDLYWSGKRSKQIKELRATCEWISPTLTDLHYKNCEYDFALEPGAREQLENHIPTKKQTNTLLVQQANGKFEEKSKPYGIQYSGWSWNAKFADLDLDSYQDLVIVNGFVMNVTQHGNLLFWNDGGKRFKDRTKEAGLMNFAPTNSYVYLDHDQDGDLDILMAPKVGPVLLYVNQMPKGNSIAFELNDAIGNFYGISARITITYANGLHQMREVQSGGGFRSFDPYTVYFGLGDHTTIDKVEVQWSSGEATVLQQPLQAGTRYRIVRQMPTGEI